LRQEGVDPSAFMWVHAHGDPDMRRPVAAAELGAWVEFDGAGEPIENAFAIGVKSLPQGASS